MSHREFLGEELRRAVARWQEAQEHALWVAHLGGDDNRKVAHSQLAWEDAFNMERLIIRMILATAPGVVRIAERAEFEIGGPRGVALGALVYLALPPEDEGTEPARLAVFDRSAIVDLDREVAEAGHLPVACAGGDLVRRVMGPVYRKGGEV